MSHTRTERALQWRAPVIAATHLRPGALVQIRGERWRVRGRPEALDGAVVDVRGCGRTNAGVRTGFVIAAEQIVPLGERLDPRPVRPSRWRRAVRRELADAVPGPDALRAASSARLSILPFQLEPALAVVRGLAHRLLIADEVGLGKTIQGALIVAELLHRHDDARALIVTPASLREQWCEELWTRFGLRASSFDAQLVTQVVAEAPPDANPWTMRPLIVTSIDYVKRPEVLAALEGLIWDAVVFDEAHQLCGMSDRAAAAAGLASRARVVVSLTATPHSGDDEAFARLCALGRLGPAPLIAFRRTRADVGFATSRRTTWLPVHLSDAERLLHGRLLEYARLVWQQPSDRRRLAHLALVVLLKRACSSPASLLRSLQRRHALLHADAPGEPLETQSSLPFDAFTSDDDEPSAVLGGRALDDEGRELELVADLVRLAQAAIAGERKLAALARLLRRISEPVIVFTEYRDTLEHVRGHLTSEDEDPAAVVVHGGLTASERRAALRNFTSGAARLLLATDAASEGLNLQARCRCVVHMELPWSPVRLEQRTGRVDRIGQQRRVHAIHLVAAGTQEEETVGRLLRRMARAGAAFGARHGNDEAAITDAVMRGGRPTGPVEVSVRAAPEGLAMPDLRVPGAQEAARLHIARRLSHGTGDREEHRAVITRIRRVPRRRRVWALRVVLGRPDEHPICTLLAGVEDRILDLPADAALVEALRCDRLGDLQRRSAASLPPIRSALDAVISGAQRAAAREAELLGALRNSRARLAPRQGRLFDRRAERLAAAQAEVLDEAMERCRLRLDRLDADAQAIVQSCELAFAVLLG